MQTDNDFAGRTFGSPRILLSETCNKEEKEQPKAGQGSAILVDSYPLQLKVQSMIVILKLMSYFVYPFEYPIPQHNQCGYIAICAVLQLSVPEWFPVECRTLSKKLFGQEYQVVKFFNSLIGKTERSIPVPLSHSDINTIIWSIEFLHSNFMVGMWDFVEANRISDLLEVTRMEIKSTESYSPLEMTVRHLTERLEVLSKRCVPDSTFKKFTDDYRECISAGVNTDWGQIRDKFDKMLKPGEMPKWFAGVFTFQELRHHLAKESNTTDRALGKRAAIFNTLDRRSFDNTAPQIGHWVAIQYQCPGDKEKLERMKVKAT